MKQHSLKKPFAFIIAMMMFSVLPQFASAQKNKPCPQGYKLECYYYYTDPWSGRRTKICFCVPNGNGNNTSYNSTSRQSIATNFELGHPSSISIKIYDATGRLIKTLADSRLPEGEHQIEWDRKDEQGNTVSAGIYILQFKGSGKTVTRKLSVIS